MTGDCIHYGLVEEHFVTGASEFRLNNEGGIS
jgi:hypothetical protein